MATSRSHAQRHAAAQETFRNFAPDVDPERISVSFSRRLGALGTMAYDVVGDMWSRPQLSRRDRSLMVISVLAAQAREEELVSHTRNGLRHGLAQHEIEEILLHVAAYAGFPAAMASSRRIDQALVEHLGPDVVRDRPGAASLSDAERDANAAVMLRSIAGAATAIPPDQGLAQLEAMLGDLGVTIYRWLFGEVWLRSQLSLRDRSLVTIAIVISLGALPELEVHVPAGLRHGLTRAEIEEMTHHLALYVGVPRAVDALRCVRAAFAKLDAQESAQ